MPLRDQNQPAQPPADDSGDEELGHPSVGVQVLMDRFRQAILDGESGYFGLAANGEFVLEIPCAEGQMETLGAVRPRKQ